MGIIKYKLLKITLTTDIISLVTVGDNILNTIVTISALIEKGLIVKVGNGNKTNYKVV